MELKEAQGITQLCQRSLEFGKVISSEAHACIILNNRITELEIQMEEKKTISKRWRDRYENITSKIQDIIKNGLELSTDSKIIEGGLNGRQ